MDTHTIHLLNTNTREMEQRSAGEGVPGSTGFLCCFCALLTIEVLLQRAVQANREDFLRFLDESPGEAPAPRPEVV